MKSSFIIPVCNTTHTGEYNAQFHSINCKQQINAFGRMSNFYNFIMVDDYGHPLWSSIFSDWCFAAIQSNVPKKGRYRHAKVHRLPRILTPGQFMNLKVNDSSYEFPSMEKLLGLGKEHQLTWKVRVEYKKLKTSTFSKITHVLNPRSNQWEETDGPVREKVELTLQEKKRLERERFARLSLEEKNAEINRQMNM